VKSKLLNDQAGQRTFVIVFERGETVMGPLLESLRAESVSAARLTGIGALESVTLDYFDWNTKQYEQHRVDGQVELLSLAGDVALNEGQPQVHAHVVGCRDTSVRGGHLIDAVVRPTLELTVEDVPAQLRKRHDAQSGLALIAPEL
jgi:hypothetical protein